MELIDFSLLKHMLIKSLENPEAIKLFINYNLGLFVGLEWFILNIFITLSILYFTYLLRKNISKTSKNKNKTSKKKIFKEAFLEYLQKLKRLLRKFRYLIIWAILIHFARLLVSGIFYIYNIGLTWYNCPFSQEENTLLGYWAFLSLIIFLIAPVFIMFCFGNKFVRNIWIFIYIFGICFIAMWKLFSISCVWMEDQEEMKETSEIEVEKVGEIGEEWGIGTGYQDNYDYIIPDSVDISVKDIIIEWEAVNLSLKMIKNWKKFDNYEGIIVLRIVDDNWKFLKKNEFTLPSHWTYSFLSSDSWEKEFQRWLEIKKVWTFYIEAYDYNDDDTKTLWRKKITVIKVNNIK